MINWFSKLTLRIAMPLFLMGPVAWQNTAAAAGTAKRVVIMIGEDEYKTWETLPAFAERELTPLGYAVRIVHEDPADKHSFPGLVDALKDADLLVLSVRRRSPPKEQLAAVRHHLEAGKSLVAIRTASHAFSVRGADHEALAKHPERTEWPEFDGEVLGGNYSGHHGAGPITTVQAAQEDSRHPILREVGVGWTSVASLYKAGPLVPDAQTLLLGGIPSQSLEPLAWTRLYGERRARVFYTSLGHESDFARPEFKRLLINAVAWGLGELKE